MSTQEQAVRVPDSVQVTRVYKVSLQQVVREMGIPGRPDDVRSFQLVGSELIITIESGQ